MGSWSSSITTACVLMLLVCGGALLFTEVAIAEFVVSAPAFSGAVECYNGRLPDNRRNDCIKPGATSDFSLHISSNDAEYNAGDLMLLFIGSACECWPDLNISLPAITNVSTDASKNGLTIPTRVGFHSLEFSIFEVATSTYLYNFTVFVEVTCSDGVFCNGIERWNGVSCVTSAAPCESDPCTLGTCIESSRTCNWVVVNSCKGCLPDSGPSCTTTCSTNHMRCGEDGCGGSCGTCGSSSGCNSTYACRTAGAGSCAAPDALFPDGSVNITEGHFVRTGDLTNDVHMYVPTCTAGSIAREHVYFFSVPDDGTSWGYEIRARGTLSNDLDLVLEMRYNGCPDTNANHVVNCADDSTPPGGYGARIHGQLGAGGYVLVVDGFKWSEAGPYELFVTFVKDCEPECEGHFCGSSGCAADTYGCGQCGANEVCSSLKECVSDTCVSNCSMNACGDDGCGGSCGECPENSYCELLASNGTRQCTVYGVCNHLLPLCEPTCASDEFCSSECKCRKISAAAPDVIPLVSEISFSSRVFDKFSCALFENCVGGSGSRRLMRFTVQVANLGDADLHPYGPKAAPQMYEYSPCHAHYHFKQFSDYALLDESGSVVVRGRKQAFCLMDSRRVWPGALTSRCSSEYECRNQGVSRRWADVYQSTIDCQWLDVTGVRDGNYSLYVALNPGRVFHERSYDNNDVLIPITISAVAPGGPPPVIVWPTSTAPGTTTPAATTPSSAQTTTAAAEQITTTAVTNTLSQTQPQTSASTESTTLSQSTTLAQSSSAVRSDFSYQRSYYFIVLIALVMLLGIPVVM